MKFFFTFCRLKLKNLIAILMSLSENAFKNYLSKQISSCIFQSRLTCLKKFYKFIVLFYYLLLTPINLEFSFTVLTTKPPINPQKLLKSLNTNQSLLHLQQFSTIPTTTSCRNLPIVIARRKQPTTTCM